MIIYFSGFKTLPEITNMNGRFGLLTSYIDIKKNISQVDICRGIKITKPIFLDSGAFSVFTGKEKVSIEEYRDFLLKHKDRFYLYANLDVIGDADSTQRNQEILEEAGLKPLPTFHYGSSYRILREMIKKYDYIGLGGIVPLALKQNILKKHLGKCFGIIGTKKKTHGWGCTSVEILKTYPFYSVDSTGWISGGKFRRKMKISFMKFSNTRDLEKVNLWQFLNWNNIKIYLKMTQEITELWKRRGIEWKE